MCPRSFPNQLTSEEVLAIGQMVRAECYRRVPTGRLAVLVQRLGKVFASPVAREARGPYAFLRNLAQTAPPINKRGGADASWKGSCGKVG